MNKIKIFWFNRYPNVGDLLGPWIVQKLSPHSTLIYSTYVTRKEALRIVIGALLRFRLPAKEYLRRLFVAPPILFTIGSILDHCNKDIVVWGSGFQNEGETCTQGRFIAVRGYESKNRLLQLGLKIPDNLSIGDPAILTPLLYTPHVVKKHKLGIVMHNKDCDYCIQNFSQYHLISVVTSEIESFLTDMCSCQYILTTSLHGLILAHTYGIPALWMQKNWIGSDGFKFKDYFSSVQMPYAKPLQADRLISESEEKLLKLFDNEYVLPPKEVIEQIRVRLLKSAPFEVLPKYMV